MRVMHLRGRNNSRLLAAKRAGRSQQVEGEDAPARLLNYAHCPASWKFGSAGRQTGLRRPPADFGRQQQQQKRDFERQPCEAGAPAPDPLGAARQAGAGPLAYQLPLRPALPGARVSSLCPAASGDHRFGHINLRLIASCRAHRSRSGRSCRPSRAGGEQTNACVAPTTCDK